MIKYVILYYFYISFLEKHIKHKNIRSKKSSRTLLSWDFKPQISRLNFDQISCT